MPNTFAPRAFERAVKDRVEELRIEYEGPRGDVKEWHAIIDLLSEDATEDFLLRYGEVENIPHVVSGVGEDGRFPPETAE